MKIMITNIIRQYSVIPLALLLAMVPVLCCCFEGTASAAVEVANQHVSDHSAHCGTQSDTSSEDHNKDDCDCPYIIAESNSVQIIKLDSTSSLFQRAFDHSLLSGKFLFYEFHTALTLLDAHYFFDHPQNSPPIFILNQTLRI